MNAKKFALIGGSVMLGLGVISLIPGVYQNFSENAVSLPPLNVETSYGLTFGFLPMNVFNKIALILFGVAGIAASRERGPIPEGVTRTAPNGTTTVGGNGWSTPIVAEPISGAILWSRVVAVMMGTLAILGLIPSTQTLYGTWPLFGAEALAHGIFAILGTFFGFRNRRANIRRWLRLHRQTPPEITRPRPEKIEPNFLAIRLPLSCEYLTCIAPVSEPDLW